MEGSLVSRGGDRAPIPPLADVARYAAHAIIDGGFAELTLG